MRNVYTVFLAVLPLVMMYRLPGTGLRMPTVLIVMVLSFALGSFYSRKMVISFGFLFPIILYIFYVLTLSTWQFSFLILLVLANLFAISTGVVNVLVLRRIIENISVIAAICVLFQQLVFRVSGYHVSFFIYNLLADDIVKSYSSLISYGMSHMMYRPSAFFLEPAHYSQYCSIGLASCLFTQQFNIRKAFLISLGILACTSGMGFVTVFVVWGWWWFSKQDNKACILRRLPFYFIIFLGFVYILDNIPFTHSIISRFVPNSNGSSNAITGRLFWWSKYFGDFKISNFLWGFGQESLPDGVYFTGFMKQLYCYGIIGVFLLLLYLVVLLLHSDALGVVCVILYVSLLFFADLTSYNNLLFYLGCFLSFSVEKKRNFDLLS